MIITDHAALKLLGKNSNLEGKLIQFTKQLLWYQYEIIFHPGQQNWLANILYRDVWVKEINNTKELR